MKGEVVFKALGDVKFAQWTVKVAGKVKIDMRWANMSGADMSGADMRWANMSGADMRGANMSGANMSGTNMRGADIRGANMRGADIRGVDMSGTDIREADMSGADLDFSSWPLWCGSVGVKIGDRIAAQLLWHIGKADVSACSPMMQDAIQHIRNMAASDVFSDEYRTELKGQDWNEK